MSRTALALLAVVGLQPLPTIGESVVHNNIRVTLLDVRRLPYEEYAAARYPLEAPWDGGGIYAAFLVENRPGASMPPALGDIRVMVGSEQYNAVINPNSSKPFAPLFIIRSTEDFFANRGRFLKERALAPWPRSIVSALEVFLPGKSVPTGASGTIELEQGETHRPDANGVLRPLAPTDIAKTWTFFQFAYPSLDDDSLPGSVARRTDPSCEAGADTGSLWHGDFVAAGC